MYNVVCLRSVHSSPAANGDVQFYDGQMKAEEVEVFPNF